MLKKSIKRFFGYYKIIFGSFSFAVILTISLYIFSLFPDQSIFLKLLPILFVLIGIISIFFYCLIIELKTHYQIHGIVIKKLKLKYKLFYVFLLFSSIVIMILKPWNFNNEKYLKMTQDQLIKNYLTHEKAYWKELIEQLKGPLSSKAAFFPEFYKDAGNLLIFPAKDGLVSVCFDKEFRFKENKFNNWLQKSSEYSGPFASIVNCNLSNKLSFTQWVQILSGNGIKLIIDGKTPNNISTSGSFPVFPSILELNPELNTQNVVTLMNIDIKKDSLLNFGLALREVSIEDIDTRNILKPFLWRQIDIFGIKALENINTSDAKLKASRELNSVLAGLNLGIDKDILSTSPFSPVIVKLESIIKQFESLLSLSGEKESNIQDFLSKNPILISPDYLKILPQASLGSEYKTDFIIVRPSDYGEQCILVEIENASHNLFNKNGDLSAILRHSLKQVSDWRSWLRDNATYAQRVHNIQNLHSDCKAYVIIGRRSKVSNKHVKNIESITLDHHHQTELLTYDDILDKARQFVINLKEIDKYMSSK
jgi:hypothetical protein